MESKKVLSPEEAAYDAYVRLIVPLTSDEDLHRQFKVWGWLREDQVFFLPKLAKLYPDIEHNELINLFYLGGNTFLDSIKMLNVEEAVQSPEIKLQYLQSVRNELKDELTRIDKFIHELEYEEYFTKNIRKKPPEDIGTLKSTLGDLYTTIATIVRHLNAYELVLKDTYPVLKTQQKKKTGILNKLSLLKEKFSKKKETPSAPTEEEKQKHPHSQAAGAGVERKEPPRRTS